MERDFWGLCLNLRATLYSDICTGVNINVHILVAQGNLHYMHAESVTLTTCIIYIRTFPGKRMSVKSR